MEQESKLRLFFQLLKGQKLKFILAMVAVAVTSLVGLLPQQVIRFTVDAVIGGEAFPLPGYLQGIYDLLGGRSTFLSNLWLCGVLMLLIYLVNSVFSFLRARLASSASETSIKNRANPRVQTVRVNSTSCTAINRRTVSTSELHRCNRSPVLALTWVA